jgi:hypothetical protein
MPRGYFARRAAERVSQHTMPATPDPTLADLASMLFRQTWRHPGGALDVINILALDAAHAVELGELTMHRRGANLDESELVTNQPWFEPSFEIRCSTLINEGDEVKENRQRLWRRRQE